MRDLSTKYLGIELPSPLVVAASPLSRDLETPLLLEDCGAGALVMESLFEEQIDLDHKQSLHAVETDGLGRHPRGEEYVERLYHLKERLSIPVIPSLNCHSLGAWIEYARMFEQARADAIELNMYFLATRETDSPAEVDDRTIEVVKIVCDSVNIPVAVKISPYHSNLVSFAKQVVAAGAGGLVLFNRFLQPDIDIERMQMRYTIPLSTTTDLLLPLTWIAILRNRITASLVASGGVQDAVDVVKAISVGADAVQVASVLLRRGAKHMLALRRDLDAWMEAHRFGSLASLRGVMSYADRGQADRLERLGYVTALRSWPKEGDRTAVKPEEKEM